MEPTPEEEDASTGREDLKPDHGKVSFERREGKPEAKGMPFKTAGPEPDAGGVDLTEFLEDAPDDDDMEWE